jgi:phosphodiesterase/alkaline phosphatase D-like protein
MAFISRRAFLSSVTLAGASVLAGGVSQRGPWEQGTPPALVTSDKVRPSIPYGVASGDVTSDAAIIWSRSNKPSRMLVEYATTDSFTNARRVQGPAALAVSDFNPFWEFVAGPLHAGTFGPNKLDNTFGPQVKFLSIPPDLKPNRPPSDGLQFFGMVNLSSKDEVMTVSLHNLRGEKIYSVALNPEI